MIVRTLALTSALLCIGACTDLPEVQRDECGNQVLELGEDCDTFTEFADDPGTHCASAEEDEANACFYVCTGEARCPTGWGCGADGRCRAATPALVRAAGSPWSFRAVHFDIGDLDGDGHADLVGIGDDELTVRYGTDTGEFPSELDVSTRRWLSRPAFLDMDGDLRMDVVIPITTGISTLLGQVDRSLLPLAYAPLNLDALVALVSDNDDAEVRVVPLESDPSNLSTELVVLVDMKMFAQNGGPQVDLPQSIDEHSSRIQTAFVDACTSCTPAVEDPREELLLAYFGAGSLYLYTTVNSGETLRPAARQEIVLPAGSSLQRGAIFGDVDGDGYRDILAGISSGGPGGATEVCVAYFDSVSSTFSSPCAVEAVFTEASIGGRDPVDMPLAAADFNGDGRADYVASQGIYLAQRSDGPVVGAPNRMQQVAFNTSFQNPWVEGEVGDFNGDGITDAVSATEGAEGLEFYLGNGEGLFNKFFVDTSSPPRFARAGDFDGDRVWDLAYSLNGGLGNADGLAVVYGAASGGPTDPVFMGEFGSIGSIEPMLAVVDEESVDVITDLLVLSTGVSGTAERSLAILQGSSERRMISPFALQSTTEPGEVDIPLRLVAGEFVRVVDEPSSAIDVLVVGGRPRSDGADQNKTWLIPGTGGGGLSSGETVSTALPAADEFNSTCSDAVPIDLDGDGLQEIAVVDQIAQCGESVGGGFSLRPSLIVVDPGDLGGGAGAGLGEAQAVTGGFVAPRRLLVRDLDADNDLDLVVLYYGEYRTVSSTSSDAAAGSGAVVYWNEGGTLDVDRRALVQVPERALLHDVGAMNLDTDPEPELVLLAATGGDGGVYWFDLDTEAGTFGDPVMLTRHASEQRLATGDLNGDGVDDLAWTEGAEVRVYLGVPAEPLGTRRALAIEGETAGGAQ